MKTIGLIGGMSWQSSLKYYQLINHSIQLRLGPSYSGKVTLTSVNFHDIDIAQQRGDWSIVTNILQTAAKSLEVAGAYFFLLCSNTVHKIAADINRKEQ